MYIHEEITKAVLPLPKKHDLDLIDLIGEMNHAAWELSVLSKAGIENLIAEATCWAAYDAIIMLRYEAGAQERLRIGDAHVAADNARRAAYDRLRDALREDEDENK